MYEYKAKVLRVVDGDTVDVLVDLGFSHFQKMRLRLFGINTPEMRGEERPAGIKAKQYVIDRIGDGDTGAQIMIMTERDRTGKYGRYIATIFYDTATEKEISLNIQLIISGNAKRVNY